MLSPSRFTLPPSACLMKLGHCIASSCTLQSCAIPLLTVHASVPRHNRRKNGIRRGKPSRNPVDGGLSDIFLLALVPYDLWSTRRIHRATLWSGIFLILIEQSRIPIGKTALWHTFATWARDPRQLKTTLTPTELLE